jgi:hypothetical protein
MPVAELELALSSYPATLRAVFHADRLSRFAGQDYLFEQRPAGGAVVFDRDHVAAYLFIRPGARAEHRQQIQPSQK